MFKEKKKKKVIATVIRDLEETIHFKNSGLKKFLEFFRYANFVRVDTINSS